MSSIPSSSHSNRTQSTFRLVIDWFRRERLLSFLLLLTPLLMWLSDASPVVMVELVHWHTIATLTGLMLLSAAIQWSGMVHCIARQLLRRLHNERFLALALCLFAAALAAVITNDVALFLVIPLTLVLGRIARLPLARLIIFQTLAVNAGSALSPIGNPQNIFLWQTSEVSFIAFTLAMLPLAVPFGITLTIGIMLAFRSRRVELGSLSEPVESVDKQLFWPTLLLYPFFLYAIEAGYAWSATIFLLAVYSLWQKGRLLQIDWALLLLFVLLFTHLGMLTRLPLMHDVAAWLLAMPMAEMTAGVLLSQVISNVPATLFLQPFSDDWQMLAWGVNIGGFGLLIGSLANLIALRLARQPKLFWQFHYWSMPCLLLSWLFTWLIFK